MWLIDHQMNMRISHEFGQYYARLPLKKAAQIHHADALETDWEEIVSKNELSYILGNPPFIGSNIMKHNQRQQIVREFDNAAGGGTLDYVTGWYIKAAKYIQTQKLKLLSFPPTQLFRVNKQIYYGVYYRIDTISKFILLIELLNGVMKPKEMQQFTVLSLVSLTTTLTIREFLSMKILEVKHTRLKQKY